MKKNIILIVLSVLLVALIALAASMYGSLSESYMPNDLLTPADTSAEITDTAPDFTFTDADGKAYTLSDFFGKPIVINFWATWCPPCKGELPAFEAAYAAYGNEVQFIMLNMTDGMRETVEGVLQFVADGGYTFPVYYDTALDGANTYGAYSIPMTVFIGADGSVQTTKVGMLNEATLLAGIENILQK